MMPYCCRPEHFSLRAHPAEHSQPVAHGSVHTHGRRGKQCPALPRCMGCEQSRVGTATARPGWHRHRRPPRRRRRSPLGACASRARACARFDGRVRWIPVSDHQPPTLRQMMHFCTRRAAAGVGGGSGAPVRSLCWRLGCPVAAWSEAGSMRRTFGSVGALKISPLARNAARASPEETHQR